MDFLLFSVPSHFALLLPNFLTLFSSLSLLFLFSLLPFFPLFSFFCLYKKVDPTNRIRTSDLRNSITNYSPPLYQLSYGRCPILFFFCSPYSLPSVFFSLFSLLIFPFLLPFFLIKFHRRESNPGHKRERLVCYQLHHNGLLLLSFFSYTLSLLSFFILFFLFPLYLLIFFAKKWIRPTGFEPVT